MEPPQTSLRYNCLVPLLISLVMRIQRRTLTSCPSTVFFLQLGANSVCVFYGNSVIGQIQLSRYGLKESQFDTITLSLFSYSCLMHKTVVNTKHCCLPDKGYQPKHMYNVSDWFPPYVILSKNWLNSIFSCFKISLKLTLPLLVTLTGELTNHLKHFYLTGCIRWHNCAQN